MHIDPSTLFNRILVLVERSTDIESYFQYELSSEPAALFKEQMMRNTNKPALAKYMTDDGQRTPDVARSIHRHVLDGGCLLHRVRWFRNVVYKQVVTQYVDLVRARYEAGAVIVFDGYPDLPSTKDHEHERRHCKVSSCPEVECEDSVPAVYSQEVFLANDKNKDKLIKKLIPQLTSAGFIAWQSSSDADVDIVAAALHQASTSSGPIAVVANDTDILVMLGFHLTAAMSDILFVWETRSKGSVMHKCISVEKVQNNLGEKACQQLLTAHALGGCDTVSAIFGHGKGSILKQIVSNQDSTHCTDVLHDKNASVSAVSKAGCLLLSLVYGGKLDDHLNKIRYNAYCHMAAVSLRRPQREKLPPTERASHFHSLRVHYQAVVWKELDMSVLDPLHWGWTVVDGKLSPVMTDIPAAPEELLKFIRCKCKTNCESRLCTCRANGLQCVSACAHCNGSDCSNASKALPAEDLDKSDDEETD